MLDGEGELVSPSAKVEVGIAPGVKVGAAAKGLAGAEVVGRLSSVVDESDGELELALQVAEETQEAGDFGGVVFIDAVKADEGVEQEELGLKFSDGVGEGGSVIGQVEPEVGGGNHLDIELGEASVTGLTDTIETAANEGGRVFGGEEEYASGAGDGESSEASRAGSDSDRHVENEETFSGLGFAADDAHGLLGPKPLDEPARGIGGQRVEGVGGLNGQAHSVALSRM